MKPALSVPKLRIYIIEDDLLMVSLVKQMVISSGHEVCGIADRYSKAIYDLQLFGADLLITDIMLNGNGTGIDIARYVNKYLHIPFIFHSSMTAEVKRLAMETLPLAFLPKPASTKQLAEVLAKTLRPAMTA